jgi:hypothetical protein
VNAAALARQRGRESPLSIDEKFSGKVNFSEEEAAGKGEDGK